MCMCVYAGISIVIIHINNQGGAQVDVNSGHHLLVLLHPLPVSSAAEALQASQLVSILHLEQRQFLPSNLV